MEEILDMFNPWWSEEYSFPGTRRANYLRKMSEEIERKNVTFLVGMRRVGKTTLMKQFIFELLENVPSEKILYISLDHPEFQDTSILDIEKRFRERHGLSMRERVFLFLDEVHLHERFELELKVLHDLEGSKVYASGSASIFLLEKGAYLTGRQHFIDVHPFGLKEYLDLKGIPCKLHDSSPLIKHAEDRVKFGGMPEYLQRMDPEYMTDLLESILYKDVLARHSLNNIRSLQDLAQLIARSVGNPISNRKIARILDISHSTVSDFISFLVEIKMIELVEREGKTGERKRAPKKIYMMDTGMARIISPSLNLGSLVENMVFNELRKDHEPRYLKKEGKEIDFVFDEYAVEVKYKDRINERDLKTLREVKQYKQKVMITRSVNEERDGIRLVPLHRFLLEGI